MAAKLLSVIAQSKYYRLVRVLPLWAWLSLMAVAHSPHWPDAWKSPQVGAALIAVGAIFIYQGLLAIPEAEDRVAE